MSSETPVEFLVAVFKGEHKAEAFWQELNQNKERTALVEELALMRKNSEGEVSISEPSDWGLRRGAALGGVVGALVGVVLGPAVLATSAVGAAIGGMASKLYDTGFDNNDLKALSEALTPDSSALLLATRGQYLAGFKQDLEQAGAAVVADVLQPGLAEHVGSEFDGFMSTLKEVSLDGLQAEQGKMIEDRVDAGLAQKERRYINVVKTGV
jgi:uncharacterized membrane protein